LARNLAFRILQDDAPMEKSRNVILKNVYIELTKKANIWNYIS